MNILYIDHYAGSDTLGMEFRPFYMAREWVSLGHDVTVVAADYTHLRSINPDISEDFTETYEEGVRFLWVKTPPYIGNRIRRIRNMYTFVGKLKKNARFLSEKYRPDVVINSSTFPMDVYPAVKIARLSNAVSCYEIHDLWPLSLMVLGNRSARDPIMKVVQRAEDYCYKHCDRVASILPDADKHIRERGFCVDFACIPNGVVLENNKAHEDLPEQTRLTLQKLHDEGKFTVMYAGGHALSNALEYFIDSAPMLPANAVLVLVGSGHEKQRLIDRAAHYDNVIFLDSVKKSSMPTLLSMADCLYLGALKSPLYSYGVGMNKIFDYMLASKPIIYGVESSNRPVDDADCGVSIAAQDSSAVADAVKQLIATPPERLHQMGQNGFNYVIKNHDYKKLAQQFLAFLQKEKSEML